VGFLIIISVHSRGLPSRVAVSLLYCSTARLRSVFQFRSLGGRKCISAARARARPRGTMCRAWRVARSNGISTRERVRGYAHEQTDARSRALRNRRGAYDTTKRHSYATAQFTRPARDSGVRGWLRPASTYVALIKIKFRKKIEKIY